MKCTHLVAGRAVASCKALEQPYRPSLFELAEYCKTVDHKKCPFYLKGVVCAKRTEPDAEAVL